jgi:hypothetical protein
VVSSGGCRLALQKLLAFILIRNPDTLAIDFRDLDLFVHPSATLALTTTNPPLCTVGSLNTEGLKHNPANEQDEENQTAREAVKEDVNPERAEEEAAMVVGRDTNPNRIVGTVTEAAAAAEKVAIARVLQ